MAFVVQKYGGTSVGSLERIRLVADHVATTKASGVDVVVVVSAMGDQTDDLIAMARSLSANPPRRELDMLVTAGERMSMALLSIALHERGLRSVSLTGSQSGILTDENHGNARIERILGDRIKNALAEGLIVIVAGFQGVSPRTREVTTLGRGGSDLSAIALASVLGASSCELYKDVDGIYSADPRQVPVARKLTSLPWYAMAEMAWAGAGIVHSRAAHVATRFGLRVEVRSSFNLAEPGTVIETLMEPELMNPTSQKSIEDAVVHAITCKRNMCLIGITCEGSEGGDSAGNLNVHSTISKVLERLWSHGEAPLIHQFMGESVRVLVSEAAVSALGVTVGHSNQQSTADDRKMTVLQSGISAITIIGTGFLQNPELVSSVLIQVGSLARPCLWDVRNQSMTIGVADAQATELMAGLHDSLIK